MKWTVVSTELKSLEIHRLVGEVASHAKLEESTRQLIKNLTSLYLTAQKSSKLEKGEEP